MGMGHGALATPIDLGGDYRIYAWKHLLKHTAAKGSGLAGRVKRNKTYSSLTTVAKHTRKAI